MCILVFIHLNKEAKLAWHLFLFNQDDCEYMLDQIFNFLNQESLVRMYSKVQFETELVTNFIKISFNVSS